MSGEKQKYAQAEIIEGDETSTLYVPLGNYSEPDGVGRAPLRQGQVRKESQAQTETRHGAGKWVEPRIRFKDLLQFLDINIWHKRSVYLKAALLTGLGWELVTDDENKEEDDAHSAIMKFLENPNEKPESTFTQIAFRAAVDYLATGNLFLEVSRQLGGDRPAGRIYHRRALTMRRDKDIKKGGYWQTIQGKKTEFSRWGDRKDGRNEVLHHFLYDPMDDYYGMAGWLPALADMLLDRSAVEFNINLFRNQLVAKFAVIVEGGKMSPEGRKALRTWIRDNATGTINAGRTIIIDSDDPGVQIKIEKLEMQFGDKQGFMGKTRETSRDMIIAAHGVPPRMVGIMSSGQLGGTGEMTGQLKAFAENEIFPQQSMMEDFYNRTILSSFGEHKWKLRFGRMDITDKKLDADVENILTKAGIKLKAESRETLGLAQIDDAELEGLTGIARKLENIRKELEQ